MEMLSKKGKSWNGEKDLIAFAEPGEMSPFFFEENGSYHFTTQITLQRFVYIPLE